MKILPFRTAPPEALEWSLPRLSCHNEVIEPGQTFRTWDYLSEILVSLDFRVNVQDFAHGIFGDERVGRERQSWLLRQCLVLLQVECASTQYRQVVDCPLPRGSHDSGSLALTIPAGVVANDLTLSAAVMLRYPVPGSGPLVPSMTGNRLLLEEPRWRIVLEGKGAAFPVSAFDFRGTGYPEGALWYLDMQAERLREPFTSAVRLLVNTGHPRSESLLGGGGPDNDLPEILHYDVLATMLEAVASLPEEDLRSEFEEGTLGNVLGELSDLYFGVDLGDVAGRIGGDLPEFKAELQRAVGFLAKQQEGE